MSYFTKLLTAYLTHWQIVCVHWETATLQIQKTVHHIFLLTLWLLFTHFTNSVCRHFKQFPRFLKSQPLIPDTVIIEHCLFVQFTLKTLLGQPCKPVTGCFASAAVLNVYPNLYSAADPTVFVGFLKPEEQTGPASPPASPGTLLLSDTNYIQALLPDWKSQTFWNSWPGSCHQTTNKVKLRRSKYDRTTCKCKRLMVNGKNQVTFPD